MEIHEQARFLILACDGLWDVIDSQKAVDYVEDSLSQGLTAQVRIDERGLALLS